MFAHHLGCSNDASAIRPLLARLIDTAKQQLPEIYGYSLSVPQDWWELVAKAVEALQSLGRWAQQNNHRWIWVLDGLDRLDTDDQRALPWLPLTIPEGVVIVASALECPAREILLERKFKTRTIAPLTVKEQEALIKQYLSRYTKQLVTELRQSILSHPLAGSPLFLRVLLDELRQCGRYETLAEQLADYLSAETVDGLYERVLVRLEADGNGENVRKVMTALWASRAGLSEEELLSITELAPLQWAPIDLALDEALGRNGNRLVFDHNFLRKAVEYRYLPTEEDRRQAHSDLADWFGSKEEWDERKAEEMPWQLLEAERKADLRGLLLNVSQLCELAKFREDREVINFWLAVESLGDGQLDELIAEDLQEEIEKRREDPEDLIWFVESIALLLDQAGLHRDLLLKLRAFSLELLETSGINSEEFKLTTLTLLANTHSHLGHIETALEFYQRVLEARERLQGLKHHETLTSVNNLALAFQAMGDYKQAELFYTRAMKIQETELGPEHPDTLKTLHNLAGLFQEKGDYEQAEALYVRCLEASERLLGPDHQDSVATVGNLATLFQSKGDIEQAELFFERNLKACTHKLGKAHPYTLTALNNLGNFYSEIGDYERAEAYLRKSLKNSENLLGAKHHHTMSTLNNMACVLVRKGEFESAISFFILDLATREEILGPEHPTTLSTLSNMGFAYSMNGNYMQAEECYKRSLEAKMRQLGAGHPSTHNTINQLGDLYQKVGNNNAMESHYRFYLGALEASLGPCHVGAIHVLSEFANALSLQNHHAKAIPLHQRELAWYREHNGDNDLGTLNSLNWLAIDLRETSELEEAEALFRELLSVRLKVLDPADFQIGRALGGLAKTLEMAGKLEEALDYSQQALDHREAHEGPDAWWTNRERLDLARVLHNLGSNSEALDLLHEFKASMARIDEPDDDDRQMIREAEKLMRLVEETL